MIWLHIKKERDPSFIWEVLDVARDWLGTSLINGESEGLEVSWVKYVYKYMWEIQREMFKQLDMLP